MRKEVHEWINDGHKILVCLDGDRVVLRVNCPGSESEHQMKCGANEAQAHDEFCWVKEMVGEYGLEAHATGIGIMVRGEIEIEWGFSGDWEEFFFKCAGYPSWKEVLSFRDEALAELQDVSKGHKIPSEMFALMPLRPWKDVDPEAKEQLREDIQIFVENEERKANA